MGIARIEISLRVEVGPARDQIRDESHDDGSRHAAAKCSRMPEMPQKYPAERLHLASVSNGDLLHIHIYMYKREKERETLSRASATSRIQLLGDEPLFRNRICFLMIQEMTRRLHAQPWCGTFSSVLQISRRLSSTVRRESREKNFVSVFVIVQYRQS